MPTTLPVDPLQNATSDLTVLLAAHAERAFPRSQELLAYSGRRAVPGPLTVTWHDMGLSPLRGAFAYLRDEREDLAPLLGTVLRITVGPRAVFVYVVGSDLIDADISLARRAYLGLAPLNVDPLLALVEVARER